jgi:hypothetical protein
MISMTWMNAPADLLGRGSFDVRPASGAGLCTGTAVPCAQPQHDAAPGTGVFAGGTAVRLRPVTRKQIAPLGMTTTTFMNNGTTLGIHSSRRPQS